MSSWHHSREYRQWRVAVIRRDKRCVVCGSRKTREAHHLSSGTYFKEQRFDISNGVCLCHKCHTNFHTNFKRSFREKCTKYDFVNFKELANYFIDIGKESSCKISA